MLFITYRVTILLLIANYVFAHEHNLYSTEVEYTRRQGYPDVIATACRLYNWWGAHKWSGNYHFHEYVTPLEDNLYLGTISFDCAFEGQFLKTNEILLMTFNQTTVYKAKNLHGKPSKNLCHWKSQFFFEAEESYENPNILCMKDNYHIRYKTSRGAFKPHFGCNNLSDKKIQIPILCFEKPQLIESKTDATTLISSPETSTVSQAISDSSHPIVPITSSNRDQTLSASPNPSVSSNSSQNLVPPNPPETFSSAPSSAIESLNPHISINSTNLPISSTSSETVPVSNSSTTDLVISVSSIFSSSVIPLIPTNSSILSESVVSSKFLNSSQQINPSFGSTKSEIVSSQTTQIPVTITSSPPEAVRSNSSLLQSLYPTFSSNLNESVLPVSSSSFETMPSNTSSVQSVVIPVSSSLHSWNSIISNISQSVQLNSTLLVTSILTSSLAVIPSVSSNETELVSTEITTASFISSESVAVTSLILTSISSTSLSQQVISSSSSIPIEQLPTTSDLSQPIIPPLYSNSSQYPSFSSTQLVSIPSISTLPQPEISSTNTFQPEPVLTTSISSQLVISSTVSLSSYLLNPSLSSISSKPILPVSSTSNEPILSTSSSSQRDVESTSHFLVPSIHSSVHTPIPFTSTLSQIVSTSSFQSVLPSTLSQPINSAISSIEPELISIISSSVHKPVPITSTPTQSFAAETDTFKSLNSIESVSLTSSIIPNTVLTITPIPSELEVLPVSSTQSNSNPVTSTSNSLSYTVTLETDLLPTSSSLPVVVSSFFNPSESATLSSLFTSFEKETTSTSNLANSVLPTSFETSSSSLSLNSDIDTPIFSLSYPNTKTLISEVENSSISVNTLSSINSYLSTSDLNHFDSSKIYNELTPQTTTLNDLTSISSSLTHYSIETVVKTTTEIVPTTLTTIFSRNVGNNEITSITLIITTSSEVIQTFTLISTNEISNLVLSSQLPEAVTVTQSNDAIDSKPSTISIFPVVDLSDSSISTSATLSSNNNSVHIAGTGRNYPAGSIVIYLAILFL